MAYTPADSFSILAILGRKELILFSFPFLVHHIRDISQIQTSLKQCICPKEKRAYAIWLVVERNERKAKTPALVSAHSLEMLGPEPWNHSNSHLHATNKLISNFCAIRVVERKRTMRQSRDPSGIRFRPIWCQQYLSLSSAQVAPVKPLIGTALFDVNAPLMVRRYTGIHRLIDRPLADSLTDCLCASMHISARVYSRTSAARFYVDINTPSFRSFSSRRLFRSAVLCMMRGIEVYT